MLGNTGQISIHNPSIADTCGSRVLGVNGSLTSYIQTGKAYAGRDTFYKKSKSKSQKMTKSEKDAQLMKRICIGTASVLGALFLGFKTKKGIGKAVDGIKKLFKIAPTNNNNTAKAKKILSKLV